MTICKDCAGKYGGVWPEGHYATIWLGICDVCKEYLSCCDLHDWNNVVLPDGNKSDSYEREF